VTQQGSIEFTDTQGEFIASWFEARYQDVLAWAWQVSYRVVARPDLVYYYFEKEWIPVMQNVTIVDNSSKLNHCVADWWKQLSIDAINDHGKFHVALAGGNTPRALYELLASETYADSIDWQHTNFYFGDERAVPLNHEQSNFRMAHEAMLDKLSIPATNVFPLIPDLEKLENCAQHYEKILHRELPAENGVPRFDLVLLGMGDDGHTASLFPDTSILREKKRLVATVFVEKLQAWRISFTYPLINNAAHVGIMVTGDNKAGRLKQILVDKNTDSPVAHINPAGELKWFIDANAAKYLS